MRQKHFMKDLISVALIHSCFYLSHSSLTHSLPHSLSGVSYQVKRGGFGQKLNFGKSKIVPSKYRVWRKKYFSGMHIDALNQKKWLFLRKTTFYVYCNFWRGYQWSYQVLYLRYEFSTPIEQEYTLLSISHESFTSLLLVLQQQNAITFLSIQYQIKITWIRVHRILTSHLLTN